MLRKKEGYKPGYPIAYRDICRRKSIYAGANQAAAGWAEQAQAAQKTTNQFIKTISANAGFQAIAKALEKTPARYVVVQTVKGAVKVATKQQAQGQQAS